MTVKGITRERFSRTMDTLFHRHGLPSKVCIAVSGGVDSMALTFLACQYFLPKNVPVTGLVVNHGLRKESGTEAREVGRLVKAFGAGCRVLKMKWAPYELSGSSSRFEIEAREKRLSLLHEACRYRKDVEHLMFAHTLDDQLETMLLRLTRGSSIRGLAGMKPVSTYWETAEPGQPPLKMVRPLLGYTKDELYQTCIENGVKWFEDATNHDPEFTIRNSIRYFLKDEGQLPKAFQKESLVNALHSFQSKRADAEQEAGDVVELLINNGRAQLDPRRASIQFTEFEGFANLTPSTLALVLQTLVARIIPTEDTGYRFSQFERLAHKVLSIPRRPDLDYADPKSARAKFSALGLDWRLAPVGYSPIQGGPRTTLYRWTVQRQLPYRGEHGNSVVFRASGAWSTWSLFDKRYWVRVRLVDCDEHTFHTVVIKYPSFRANDLSFMKRFMDEREVQSTSPYDVLIQPCIFLATDPNIDVKASAGKGFYKIEDDSDYTVVGCPMLMPKRSSGSEEGTLARARVSLVGPDGSTEQYNFEIECILKDNSSSSYGNSSIPVISSF